MKNILVTGGAGYIGSHVVNLLIYNGYNVTVIDNLITGHFNLINKKAKFYNYDIADKPKVNELLANNKFDIIMHFAGLISVGESVKKPKKYYEYNYTKAKILIDLCIKNNLKKIIFSSTASVYGNPKKIKVSESDNLKPLNPYALTKLKFEKYLIKQGKINKIKYIILRYFNVAGADKKLRSGLISKNSTHLIKIASEVAVGKRSELTINGNNYNTPDGTPVRDYIHVSDLADIHVKSLHYLNHHNKSFILNCGYGKGYSVKQVVNIFKKIKKNLTINYKPKRPGDVAQMYSNTKKLKQIFRWKAKFNNINLIIKSAIKWEKKLSTLK